MQWFVGMSSIMIFSSLRCYDHMRDIYTYEVFYISSSLPRREKCNIISIIQYHVDVWAVSRSYIKYLTVVYMIQTFVANTKICTVRNDWWKDVDLMYSTSNRHRFDVDSMSFQPLFLIRYTPFCHMLNFLIYLKCICVHT